MRPRTFIAVCTVIALSGCGQDVVQQPDQPTTTDSVTHYAVGSKTFFIHDESRGFDTVAGVDTGIRSLITEIWYPVDADATEGHRRATYGDYVFGNRDMHRLMMTGTTFFHMTPHTVRDGVTEQQIDAAIDELFERERESWVDAAPAALPEKFPVIVMSHGDAGSRYNMESVCEYLAASGYFVIAADHTGNSPFAMTGSDPALASDARFSAAMEDVLPLLIEHGSFGVSGPFWWPDLKPNTQNRHFDPEVSFDLVTPILAHQMQKELALAFFDVTIRGDDGALQRLQENNYESQGQALELRNF